MSEDNEHSSTCGNCSARPAVWKADDIALCVDCFYRFTVAQTLQLRNAVMGMNHAAAEMDFISGLPNFTPRMQVPDLPKAPMTLNNIHVDRSVVGSINTGEVEKIDVSITLLDHAGNKDVGNALRELTEAIVNASVMSSSDKSNMLDQVSYLSEQATAASKDRKPGMIRAALSAITSAAGAVTAVAGAWSITEPILKAHFGL